MPGRRAEISPGAEAAAYAIDPKRHLSSTPATPMDDVDGGGDWSGGLSMAAAGVRGPVDGGGDRRGILSMAWATCGVMVAPGPVRPRL